MKLALFDFDGTISTKDSFKDFILFTHGFARTILAGVLLSPIMFLFAIKVLSNTRTKEFVIKHLYRGWEKKHLQEIANRYARECLPKIIKKSALEKIAWHRNQGHKVIVVSASPEIYLLDWCAAQNIGLIATKIEYQNDLVTGRIEGKNCHGEEKVRRIKESLDLRVFEYVYAYGDSYGDKPLAAIANEFHYRNFK